MKKFNITGLCVPEENYMVDVSGKITKIKELVDSRCYFTINRARQFGKTTVLNELEKALKNEYLCASISFESLGTDSFSSSKSFCYAFMDLIHKSLQFTSASETYAMDWMNAKVDSFELLSDHISIMCRDEKVVLMIDEVDKASSNQIFLQFLSVLRSKFLARQRNKDHTFHSVLLAGVYDIKNIKFKMIQEGLHTSSDFENKIYNSPWNIATDFNVEMSFSPSEITSMLIAYESEQHTGMFIAPLAEAIHGYTDGYPFLVSWLCKCIDEKLDRDWTLEGVRKSVENLLIANNTLFDDLFKNIENNKSLYELIYDVLIVGKKRLFSIDNPTVNLAAMYGIVKNSNRMIVVSNRIFEIRICNYFISKDEESNGRITGVLQQDVMEDGKFNMELCLRKFAEHYSEIYNEYDLNFLERHGRLLFLSYLKPLINGQGFYHIESQFTDSRRMDIVVDFGKQQFVVELKVWRGQQYHSEAYDQLCGYLDSKKMHEGYLLTFDFRKRDKVPDAGWRIINGKRIFDVIV
jgi:hypothetical protein